MDNPIDANSNVTPDKGLNAMTSEGLRSGSSLGTDLGGADLAIQSESVTNAIQGHPIGFWFFFWGEFAERSSYYGMKAILAKYMADALSFGQANAATYMAYFMAACYILPLIGGWVADKFFGKYWTIVGFSLPYILGHVILGYENPYCLVIALVLLAMGSGVIKPNISTLMGLTYDEKRPGQAQLRSDAFSMFYFAINFGAVISQFGLPPIRTAYGYWVAFLVPAGLMVVSFGIFAAGKRFYAKEVISNAPVTTEENQNNNAVLLRLLSLFALVMFFWAIFDQSSSTWIFFAEACMNLKMFGLSVDSDQIQAANSFFILFMVPLVAILFRLLAKSGIHVLATSKMLLGFILTAACMGVMALAGFLAGPADLRPANIAGENIAVTIGGPNPITLKGKMKIAVEDEKTILINGDSKTLTMDGKDSKLTGSLKIYADHEIKMVRDDKQIKVENAHKVTHDVKTNSALPDFVSDADLPISITIADEKEVEERWYVAPEKKVTVWWQILAFLVITVAEVLISVTGLELAYTAAPKSMTGLVTACWLLTVGLANLFINARVTRFYTVMQPMTYFGLLALLLVLISVLFFFVAKQFNRVAKEKTA